MIQIFNPPVCESVRNAFRDWVVVIDDGHGWMTSGKRSTDGSLRENEFNSSMEDKFTLMLNMCDVEYYSLASGWADEELMNQLGLQRYAKQVVLAGDDIEVSKIDLNNFEPFDEQVGTLMAIYSLAYIIGLDVRDIWPITLMILGS